MKRVLVDRGKKHKKNYRSQVNTLNNSLNISLVFFIVIFWSGEIQEFALSIAAFMFAIVFATKEYIQCFLGYFFYLSARPFRIGDWIQVQDGIGEVIAADWTKVTLLEVDPHSNAYTGKHLFIPNNQLLLKTVKNLNFLRRYSMHQFTITCEPLIDIVPIVSHLEKRAEQYLADFHDVAERYKSVIEKRMDIEFIEIKPHFHIHTNKFAKVCITVDLFCPVEQNLAIEQSITQEFFQLWHLELNKLPVHETLKPASLS
ncbi:mechanosensitive ion channel family protein [Glaciecola sp. MH2013]|uniref:mechanosensitive ion channel family protein n=1 Tax=Glaciecola sp. MH2013 TaxID=2785524 RepID=UPI001E36B8A8|nr:mechanosensitive ion channel family protein [Glaciecola sp. MH2013]